MPARSVKARISEASGRLEAQPDGVRVRHLHLLDAGQLGGHGRDLPVLRAGQVEAHRLRVEGRAVVELDVLPQLEDERLRIRRLPRLGQPRPRVHLVVEADQGVEHRVEIHVVGARRALVRVEGRDLGAQGRAQGAAGARGLGLRGGAGDEQQERGEPGGDRRLERTGHGSILLER